MRAWGLFIVFVLTGCVFPMHPASGAAIPVVSFHKVPDGLVFKMEPGILKLQVFSPYVIRVLYAPGKSLSKTKSMAVITKPFPVTWREEDDEKEVRILTDELQVHVNCATGAIGFYDRAGSPVLVEEAGGGKSLTPNQVGNLKTLKSQQSFVLEPGEAIYGLGQHQQGLMNYRGANVRLLQANREVGVPVMVSSRGYGLLWDNPAVTDVSVGAGIEQTVPSSHLYTEDGKPGGLTGKYYKGENFETFAVTHNDAQVDFDWSTTPPPGMPHDHYSVRWTGYVEAGQGGEYTFLATADDGVRLWIDDKQVVNDWNSRPVETFFAKVNFSANSRHRIKMEYYQDRWGAVARLVWRLPTKTVLPLTWTSEAADSIDYYFMYGANLDKVIGAYRGLTGAAPMFPKWAWGFWQSKEHYQSQQELLDVVDKYRSLHVPIDGIIQDWQYWSPHPWGSHQFDKARYPEPGKMMEDIHAKNTHMIISVWPRFDDGSPNSKELGKAGCLYPQVISYDSPPIKSHWYDPFDKKARRIYWEQISRELFAYGIDGWWLDASEPELSGNPGEYHNYTTAMGPATKVFNAYPLMHTGGIYIGQRAENSDKRVFGLTRSAYAGQQRYSMVTWSGDIQGSWSAYLKQIPAGINFCLSGIPYWNTDTGGFFGGNPAQSDYAELFTRWFQFSAFCPMFRVHGTNYPKEMWRFDDATRKILVDYDRLRYHMLPYIYSVSWMVTHENYSMFRGLIMDFREDPKVYDISDQYLFGPSLMVSPVTKAKAKSRSVYLPEGANWTDFWTGKTYIGGKTVEAKSPMDIVPLFVRAGSIIPYGPSIEYATEKEDPIEIRVYPGADGAFTLYEDEGDNYNYEKGAWATIPLTWNEATRTLKIGKRSGGFAGMLKDRTFRVVWVSPGHGTGIFSTEKPDTIVQYDGMELSVIAHK